MKRINHEEQMESPYISFRRFKQQIAKLLQRCSHCMNFLKRSEHKLRVCERCCKSN